jgi:hypothetical protein
MPLRTLTPSTGFTDVQDTTLAKDAIARFVCNTWDEAIANPEGIDVVVVGAGLFGGYCGSKIYELSRARTGTRPLRVLLLEAGPFLVPEHTQNVPNLGLYDPGIFNAASTASGAPPLTRNLVWGVGWRSNRPFVGQAYCVGGKGIFWGGWCPRLQAADLQQWPAEVAAFLTQVDPQAPVGVRPIEHKDPGTQQTLARGDALTGYEALEYEIGVAPADDFVFDPMASAKEGAQVGLNEALRVFLSQASPDAQIQAILPAPIAVQTQSFISGLFALDKYSSVPALIGSARADHSDGRTDNLRMTVVPNVHVVRLQCAPSSESPLGTRTVQTVVVRHEGVEKTLMIAPHCQVVLALSCIESTRLALESFSLESSLLRPPGQELMGRNFMFHVRADIAFRVDRARVDAFVQERWPGKSLAELLQLASLHVQCDGAHGRYQYQLYAATNSGGPDANMYQMVPDLDVQRSIAASFNASTVSFVLRSSGEVIESKTTPVGSDTSSFINLAGPADFDTQFGHNRAWVGFRTAPDHAADPIWQDMHDTAHAIARALANGGPLVYTPVNGSSDFTLPAFSRQQGVGSTFHDAGTLWMGDDPDSSVTDANGHFHHVSNAYCCDQALFPTVGSANPALTGLCLARKVAGDIVARHVGVKSAALNLGGFAPVSLARSNGWLAAPYDGVMEIDSGALIETQPTSPNSSGNNPIGLYYLPRLLADFELVVEWKAFRTPTIPNSGILLRTPNPIGVNFADSTQFARFYDATTEIQIDELGKDFNAARSPQAIFGNSRFKTGAVYGVAPATQWASTVLAPDGSATAEEYWNTYRIRAVGNTVQVDLNRKRVCDAVVPASKRLSGFLAFQFHTGRVQFRNLFLKTL